MFELLLKQGELEEPPVNGEQEKSYLPSIHWFQDPDGQWWRVNKHQFFPNLYRSGRISFLQFPHLGISLMFRTNFLNRATSSIPQPPF